MKYLNFILVLLPFFSFSQTGVIEGRVYDEINNEAIIGANIGIKDSTIGTSSDLDGNYRIEGLKPGLYNIEVSYLGYLTVVKYEIQVFNSKPVRLNVAMKLSTAMIDSVVVTAKAFTKKEETPLSLISIGVNEIQRNPGGNRDISRSIKNLPGVSSGVGFRNDLLVRGGAPNENRFYLDDIEIPTINHFQTQGASGGSNGLLNVDFINNADFFTGSFPASKGNALSSVLALTQREGRNDRVGFTFTIGASDAGITVEGPMTKKKKTTFLLNGRYSYLQGLFKALKLPFLPTYSDAQFKIMHKFNTKHDLTILGVGAYDMLRLNLAQNKTEEQRFLLNLLPNQNQWNYTLGVRYRYFMEKSFMLITASRSMFGNAIYKYYNNNNNNSKIYNYHSTESENKLKFEHTYRIKGYKLSYGINYEFAHYTNESNINKLIGDTVLLIDYNSTLNLHKYGLFFHAAKSYFDDKFSISAGFRADGNNYNKNMANLFNQFSPRISFSYSPHPMLSINLNSGLYYQMPTYTTLGYRDGTGTLINKNNLKYIRNAQLVGGIGVVIPNSNTKFALEAFGKWYSNYPYLIEKGISLANLGGDYGWVGDEPAISTSKGRTYGIEFSVQQKLWKGIFGIMSYTWFRSTFTDYTGKYKPSSWDARHVFNITLGYKFKRNWELGVKWSIQGALPYTPYNVGAFADTLNYQRSGGIANPDYTLLNTKRTKVQHGMNFRVDKKWFLKKININLYLDLQNVYFSKTQTPPYIDLVRDANGNPELDPADNSRYKTKYLDTRSGSIIPSIGFVLEY